MINEAIRYKNEQEDIEEEKKELPDITDHLEIAAIGEEDAG